MVRLTSTAKQWCEGNIEGMDIVEEDGSRIYVSFTDGSRKFWELDDFGCKDGEDSVFDI